MDALHKVPNDILLLIFLATFASERAHYHSTEIRFGPGTGRPYAYIPTLTHICRRWRTLALECPLLWNDIVITKRSAEALETFLERTQLAPLDVQANVDALASVNTIFHQDRHRVRVRSWDIRVPENAFGDILRELGHDSASRGSDSNDLKPKTVGRWPALKRLQLEIRQSRHRSLELLGSPAQAFPLNLLTHMPNLTHLGLTYCNLTSGSSPGIAPLEVLAVKKLVMYGGWQIATVQTDLKTLEAIGESLEMLELYNVGFGLPVYLIPGWDFEIPGDNEPDDDNGSEENESEETDDEEGQESERREESQGSGKGDENDSVGIEEGEDDDDTDNHADATSDDTDENHNDASPSTESHPTFLYPPYIPAQTATLPRLNHLYAQYRLKSMIPVLAALKLPALFHLALEVDFWGDEDPALGELRELARHIGRKLEPDAGQHESTLNPQPLHHLLLDVTRYAKNPFVRFSGSDANKTKRIEVLLALADRILRHPIQRPMESFAAVLCAALPLHGLTSLTLELDGLGEDAITAPQELAKAFCGLGVNLTTLKVSGVKAGYLPQLLLVPHEGDNGTTDYGVAVFPTLEKLVLEQVFFAKTQTAMHELVRALSSATPLLECLHLIDCPELPRYFVDQLSGVAKSLVVDTAPA
ncbi:hypothetical protein EIP91_009366 [Steccherinum ochraceum]|uniref:Uncharacterized protein n=1 Tax=Steccherinum ochraceum TaxID=92696 RepID=A0A4R0R9V0_9APHY|nr:hypothetical protein EIP91_009366 [Steccherinum ochraceum]